MSGVQPYLQYYQASGRADFGRRSGIICSLGLHLLAVAAMFWFGSSRQRPPKPFASMPVALVERPTTNRSGKQRKAPVAGRERTRKTNPEANNTPTPPKDNKKTGGEVGLKRDEPEKKKKEPEKPAANPAKPSQNAAREPDPLPDEPQDLSLPIARGGLGGEDESGISFSMGANQKEIDIEDVEFLSYMRLIQSQIARRWSKGSLVGGTTTIRFQVHRDGSISNVEIVKSAGKAYLDGPSQRAVMGAELPSLPQGLREDVLIVNVNFHYGQN